MLIAVIAATLLTYSSDRCGFSFKYPASWTVTENPAAKIKEPGEWITTAECAVGLRPPGWRKAMRESKFDLAAHPLRVAKFNRGFIKAAQDSFFMKLDTGGWGIASRGVPLEAVEFRTKCCQGLRGTSWSRVWTRDGEVGTHVWEGALVNDRKGHSVIIESDCQEWFKPVVTDIINSIRFHTPGKRP